MDTTALSNQPLPTSKPPLLTRIRERLREARDEYFEYIETEQNRAAVQKPPQKQARKDHPHRHDSEPTETHGADINANAVASAKSDEIGRTRDTDSGHERKEKNQHKARRHHNRDGKNNPHQEPDNRGRHKHIKPDHRKHPHGKHKAPALQESTDTKYLVERLVRRVEKGIEDEVMRVEYLQDAAQRLHRIAEERGKSASDTRSTNNMAEGSGTAPNVTGHTNESKTDIAEELVQQAKELEEGFAHHGDNGHCAALHSGEAEQAGAHLTRAIESKHGNRKHRRRNRAGGSEAHPSGREAGEEGRGNVSPLSRGEEDVEESAGSVSSLSNEGEEEMRK
ncbi:hypothetical protein MMC18_004316 [Xylographa bjoerkii]|nr:hypothetical protein [Xylographa bjoerkii]